MWGRAGNDTLKGKGGNDHLIGGAGKDTMDGGAGTDDEASYRESGAAVTVDLSTTKNDYSSGKGGEAEGDKIKNIENLTGSPHDDTLTGDGNENSLFGLAGNDTLAGGGGDD